MTTLIPFVPNAVQPFQFTATLDGEPYNVICTWNIFGQRYYVNVYAIDGTLIFALPMIASSNPRPLAAPLTVETVASLTWADVAGGTVTVVMAEPSIYVLGDTIEVSGATNDGTAGDGAVNGPFVINGYTDNTHFTFMLTATAGGIGTIAGSPVLVVTTFALVWSNVTGTGTVTATTAVPHGYRIGVPLTLTVSNATPVGYNGTFTCAPTGPSSFTYPLATDPGANTAPGSYGRDVALTAGYFTTSTLVWRQNANQFEVNP